MRTTYQIIEDVKDGKDVEKDELRYCLLAIDAMSSITTSSFHGLLRRKEQWNVAIPLKIQSDFDAWKRLLNVSPKHWLGDNVPENQQYQTMRRISLKLFNKFSQS